MHRWHIFIFLDENSLSKLAALISDYMHQWHFFSLQFGLANELIAPKNQGESIYDIEILALLDFFKPYISVQE